MGRGQNEGCISKMLFGRAIGLPEEFRLGKEADRSFRVSDELFVLKGD